MPRNVKCRQVCAEFSYKLFIPEKCENGFIILMVDELEAIRLCDLENMDQEKAAERMNVSRGTLQRILYSARKKIAEALCEGKGIMIEGGNYAIGKNCPNCNKQCRQRQHTED